MGILKVGRGGQEVRMKLFNPILGTIAALFLGSALTGCQPTVKVQAPSEPITINLNIKLEADVLVRVEDKAKDDIAANPDIF
jgi:hypothetical protein